MITISVVDEINCCVDGLTAPELSSIIESMKYKQAGAFMTSAYKLGMWDGKVSMVKEDGTFFFYHIDKMMAHIHEMGYSPDDIHIEDFREPDAFPDSIPMVDEEFLYEELGYLLRDHQIDGINLAGQNRMGILDLATNAGKTAICLGISKLFDPYIKVLVVVPSNILVKQTIEDYEKCSDIKSTSITSNDKKDARVKKLQDYNHIVLTTRLFQNLIEEIKQQKFAIIVDEAHIFGEVMESMFRYDIPHFPVRIGMTGSVPEDALKLETLKAHLCGDVLRSLEPKELIALGYAAIPYFHEVIIKDKETEDLFLEMKDQNTADDNIFDWSIESSYLNSNTERAALIQRFIEQVMIDDSKNTLVLCNPGIGKLLSEGMGIPIIVDETPDELRSEYFSKFTESNNHLQLASYGTSSTGISINEIYRLIMIDVANNKTRIYQSIGRSLRLDGTVNEVDIIDISSDTVYSKKHRKNRRKRYREQNFNIVSTQELVLR